VVYIVVIGRIIIKRILKKYVWERGLESNDSVLNTCEELDLPVY
jgi:hypothetical protein